MNVRGAIKKLRRGISRRTMLIVAVVLFVVVAGCVGYYLLNNHPAKDKITETKHVKTDAESSVPEYDTVLPSGKTIEQLGGWTRVSPTDRNPVFAYVDNIDNIQINVSEQPLPDDFKEDTAVQLEQLATGYKANEKITVGDSIVHIGTSAKGPQSVIFNKDNVLILIKSTARIENDKWAAYINALKK